MAVRPGSSGAVLAAARRPVAAAALVACLLAPRVAGAQPFELLEATIDDVHAALAAGRLTCRELVQGYLDRIAAYDQAGPALNAVQQVNPGALEAADALDAAFAESGPVGPLHCAPVLLKDQVETRDLPTTYGSALFDGFVSGRDATIVTRLETAGAITLAKTNMGEFASRYVGSAFGVIRNAYDPTRNPSGSSGGTGAGIAANFGLVGIGEDTGGSIRGPSAVHGLVGLRPTVPLVSRFGMMPANPSSDTLGPMTRTVRDAALVLDAIAGYDPQDPVTAYAAGRVPDSYAAGLDADALRGARIGIIREALDPKTDPEANDYRQVRAVIDRAFADLAALGATVIDPVAVTGLETVDATYVGNDFETEAATDAYLETLADPPASRARWSARPPRSARGWRRSSLCMRGSVLPVTSGSTHPGPSSCTPTSDAPIGSRSGLAAKWRSSASRTMSLRRRPRSAASAFARRNNHSGTSIVVRIKTHSHY